MVVWQAYLIIPHPSAAAVYVYMAKFPLGYLTVLRDPCLEVAQDASITRELIELPVLSAADTGDVTEGRFLDVLSQILEEADSHERPFSKWFLSKKRAEAAKRLRYRQFNKMAHRLKIQMIPERLLGKRKGWRTIRRGIRRHRKGVLFPRHRGAFMQLQSALRKLDYISSLRPRIPMCLVPRNVEAADRSWH